MAFGYLSQNINKKSSIYIGWLLFLVAGSVHAGSLTCSITTSAACTGTVILRMSDVTNAHAELPSQSTAAYNNAVVCCSGVTGLGNSCSGTNATVLKLSDVTNAHSEINSQTNYTNNACISVGAGGYVNVGYQATNCSGYDATLASIESNTNSHVGDGTAYTTKVCASASSTALIQTLSFSLSANSASFGVLSPAQTRYASTTGAGDGSEVEAFNLQVNTNAPSGYFVTVQGATLTSGAATIAALGGTNTAPSIGAEQFGIRATVSGSNGVVASPYDGSGFAYAADASTASVFATAPVGDGATSTYSVRMMANVSIFTDAGNYTTTMVYVATANF